MSQAENLKVINWGNGRNVLTIESDKLEACYKLFTSRDDITGVRIDPYMGFKLSDIGFLQNFSNLQGVVLEGDGIDISSIHELKELTYISISNNSQLINYSVFPNLTEIRSDWHSKTIINDRCRQLKHLCLWKYKPQTMDLSELPTLDNLQFLGFVQSTLYNTKGIGKYKQLKHIELAYCSKLTTLCDMEDLAVENLNVEVCRKLQNHEYVEILQSLKKLKLNDCGAMNSIEFINRMPNLEDFRFVRTDIKDGDITPCLKLKGCGFSNKRHFSHTYEQVQKIMQKKGDETAL